MVEKAGSILNTQAETTEGIPAAQDATSAQNHFQHTEIKGRFDQFRSSYWGAAMAALGLRYAARPVTRQYWNNNSLKKYWYSSVAGLIMYGVTGMYASQTYRDMRNVFSEALGWEFNKKPEDTGIMDMLKSENAIIHRTVWNFFKYNAKRFGVNTLFFLPLIPGVGRLFKSDFFKKHHMDHAETPIDVGVAGNAWHLMNDIFARRETFFEKLQAFIDRKINHTDSLGDVITASDLISLYARHARDDNPSHPVSERMDTPAWSSDQILFSRMAELMNETYGNMPSKEPAGHPANFTVPKFLYLLGQKTVKADTLEENLAYVEVANRYGIPAVKQVVEGVKEGKKLEEVLKNFPLKTPEPAPNAPVADPARLNPTKFVEKLGESRPAGRAANQSPPASYVDKTAKGDSPAPSVSV